MSLPAASLSLIFLVKLVARLHGHMGERAACKALM